jgi:predicted DNA-binding antitoxin AbrB/MazE fold protein
MLKIIPCIYRNGRFVPQIPVDFPEGAEVQNAFCRDEVDLTETTQEVVSEQAQKELKEENSLEKE